MADTAWVTSRCQSSAVISGVVPHPEASQVSPFGRPQPGQPASGNSQNATQQPNQSSTPTPTLTMQGPAACMRQRYIEPRTQRWYHYDPTQARYQLLSAPYPHPVVSSPCTAVPGPPVLPASSPPRTALHLLPNIAGADTSSALPTGPVAADSTLHPSNTASTDAGTSLAPRAGPVTADPTLAPLVASLNALQFQFATFRDSLSGVQLDLKDTLAQLQALRAAHTKTDKSIAELEGVVGVDGATTASTRSRGRARRSRGRGRGRKVGVAAADVPLGDEGSAADAVPERKTLVQSTAAIQAAIESLLARDGRASDSYLQEETLLPSTDPARLALPLPSVIGPSLRRRSVPPTYSNSVTSSASQSELLSPLSSTAVPTPESATSPPSAVPAKEYANVSIQTCSPPSAPESACSLLNAHRHISGLVPVDWSVGSATHGRYASNLVRPTTFTAEYLALFPRDAHLPSASSSVTDSQTPQSDLSPLPSKPVADSLGAQRAEPNTSSSSDTSTLPSAGGSTPAVGTVSHSVGMSIQSSHLQAPSLAIEATDYSITLPRTGQLGGSQTLPSSSLTSLSSSTHATPNPKQLHAETDSEDTRIPSDADSDSVSLTSRAKLASGATLPVSDDRRESPPLAPNEGGLPSSLTVPPSETVYEPEPQVIASSPLTTSQHDAGIDPKLTLRPRLEVNFSVTSAPPSAGEDRGALVGSEDADPRWPRPGSPRVQALLTPPLFYPNLAGGELLTEEGTRNVGEKTEAHTGVEEYTYSLNEGDATEGVATNAPVITPTNVPLSSHGEPRAAGDVDVSTSPRSSASQPSAELPPAPDLDANDITGSAYSFLQSVHGYDIRFSSPLRPLSPSTTTTTPPSRYATPPQFTDAMCLAQDKDELWHALMRRSGSGSGVSTPLSLEGMLSSEEPLPASSLTVCPHGPSLEQISVDPSVPHDPPSLSVLLVDGHRHGRKEGGTSSLRILEGSLSPLTPLDEMACVDEGGDRAGGAGAGADMTQHDGRKTHTPISTSRETAHRGSGTYRGRRRRSEPGYAELPHVARAASEATVVGNGDRTGFSTSSPSRRVAGGPSASLDELMMLARREPLRIHLRIPERMRGMKRKRDVDICENEGARASNVDERLMASGDRDGDGEVKEAARLGDAPPAQAGEMSALGRRTPTSTTVSRSAPKHSTSDGEVTRADAPECSASSELVDTAEEHPDRPSDSPASHKRTRKESQRGKQYLHARHKKPRLGQKVKPKSPMSVHVRNGQLVTVGPRLPMPTIRPGEEADHTIRMRTPTQVCQGKGQENWETKVPSSPQCPVWSIWSSSRGVKSSPKKEDVWDTISRSSRTWPQLPPTFDHWDCQFIQCDNCDRWYHYGCVGVKSGDPRLKPAILFICLTCHAQNARRQTLRNQNETCARPDCPEPQLIQDSGLFFIERLVGRKKIEGYAYMWLAKWEGYPMTEATWIPKENVVGDGERLFNLFIGDANEEGADLSQDIVLLQEAMDAGWASEAY